MARSRGREEKVVSEAAPQNDAYTGLLAISLVATLTGLVFVWMDYSDYSAKPPRITTPASISQVEPSAAGNPGGGAQPVGNPSRPPAKKGG